MIDQHLQTGAGVTIAGLRVPRDGGDRVRRHRRRRATARSRGFLEKPADPPGLPDSPEESFASMGNYVFTTDALLDALRARRRRRGLGARHGRLDHADARRAGATPASTTSPPTSSRARPSATTATGATSGRSTPTSTRTWTWCRSPRCSTSTTTAGRSSPLPPQLPPAKFVLGGRAEESMVSAGVIIGGGSVHNCVVSPGVRVERGARVEDSVLMDGVVHRRGRVRAPGDPGQERRRARRGRGSVSTTLATASATTSSAGGVTVAGQGRPRAGELTLDGDQQAGADRQDRRGQRLVLADGRTSSRQAHRLRVAGRALRRSGRPPAAP